MASAKSARAALDLVATLLVAAVAAVMLYERVKPSGIDVHLTAYEVGDRLEDRDRVGVATDRPTLLVWVRSTCSFCTESMPLYRQLVADPDRRSAITFIGPEAIETLKAYLGRFRIVPDAVISGGSARLRLSGTPRILLVAPDGRIEAAWLGYLGEAPLRAEVVAAARSVLGTLLPK